MKLTEKDIQERREKIILTAFRLFCDKGIEAVTLLEVAREAGVGETTIYRYFENKATLVTEAFVLLWNVNMCHVEEDVLDDADYQAMTGYEQIASWIQAFKRLYRQNSDFVLFSYEAKLYLVRHNRKFTQYQQDILMSVIKATFYAAIEKGRADGTVQFDVDSEDIFYAIWGTIRGYIVKIVIYDRLYGVDNPWEKRYDLICRGILAALHSGELPLEIRTKPKGGDRQG